MNKIDKERMAQLEMIISVHSQKGHYDLNPYSYGLGNGLLLALSLLKDEDPKFLKQPDKFLEDTN